MRTNINSPAKYSFNNNREVHEGREKISGYFSGNRGWKDSEELFYLEGNRQRQSSKHPTPITAKAVQWSEFVRRYVHAPDYQAFPDKDANG